MSCARRTLARSPGLSSARLDSSKIVWKDVDGSTKENRDATYDFGTAYSGDKIPKQLIVKNLGSGPLTLTQLNFVSVVLFKPNQSAS